jgi:hypothetical protein
MGLDMYLTKHHYVQNWDHQKPEHRHTFVIKKGGKLRTDIKPERISYIIEQVCYWRKANAIHGWFVKNVQGGKDDCRDYHVAVEKLQELVAVCDEVLARSEVINGVVKRGKVAGPETKGKWKPILEAGEVIANPDVAEDLLPTKEGFFFGSVDYDDAYLQDIRETRNTLQELLQEDPEGEGDYYYRASW